MVRAALRFGVRCVGVTLSQNRFELARERVHAAGVADRVEIRLQDYREVSGQYDRITSVGMFEHVGRKNLPGYFRHIGQLLANGGIVMNHGITSTDSEGGETPHGVGSSSTATYLFPNAELPHIGLALQAMQEGGWKPSMWRPCAATTPAPCGSGRQLRAGRRMPAATGRRR